MPSDTAEQVDTAKLAAEAGRQLGASITEQMLRFGATVRRDEAAKAMPSLSLLKTIGVNVDNSKLSDADFRAFVRNSLATN